MIGSRIRDEVALLIENFKPISKDLKVMKMRAEVKIQNIDLKTSHQWLLLRYIGCRC